MTVKTGLTVPHFPMISPSQDLELFPRKNVQPVVSMLVANRKFRPMNDDVLCVDVSTALRYWSKELSIVVVRNANVEDFRC